MRTLKLVISFDGTGYSGWQRQENAVTIQSEIERCTSLICNAPTVVHGAGRTDSGVHALGMVAHFKTMSRISCPELLRGLNSVLPPAIRILEASEEEDDFHARYSALGKTYRYALYNGAIQCPTLRFYSAHCPHELDMTAIDQCLSVIVGTHDFSSFENSGSRDRNRSDGRGAVRTIFRAWRETAEPQTLLLYFTGDGFLRQMVRNLTGTILEAGRNRIDASEFKAILQAEDRSAAAATAPSHGLTLLRVHYEKDW